jgi:predicted kinase
MPNALILVGIPTSGKTTFAIRAAGGYSLYSIISRDNLRIEIFGGKYKQNHHEELRITKAYDELLKLNIDHKLSMILDNTHCRDSYIIPVLTTLVAAGYDVRIKFFDIPLWKAYYRNFMRGIRTGKWIPRKVIKAMKKNYDKIDKTKYANYVY